MGPIISYEFPAPIAMWFDCWFFYQWCDYCIVYWNFKTGLFQWMFALILLPKMQAFCMLFSLHCLYACCMIYIFHVAIKTFKPKSTRWHPAMPISHPGEILPIAKSSVWLRNQHIYRIRLTQGTIVSDPGGILQCPWVIRMRYDRELTHPADLGYELRYAIRMT